MKLLFDQNLSPRLAAHLADAFPDAFPDSSHVFLLGLDQARDSEIWNYAREHDFVLVTKDADFAELGTLHGFPPYIVWLRVGNGTTNAVETLLRSNQSTIERLATELHPGIVSLF